MAGYTKLFASILDSSIWLEDSDIKVVWITMLAMANQHGEIVCAVPNLARRAGVSREACDIALKKFLSPDPDSKSKAHEGRRIAEIDGGWLLLNYVDYRNKSNQEDQKRHNAERQRRFRENQKLKTVTQNVTQSNGRNAGVTKSNDKAEAEAEAVQITSPAQGAGQPSELPNSSPNGVLPGFEDQQPKTEPPSEQPAGDKPVNPWALWIDVNRESGRTDPANVGPDLAAAKQLGKLFDAKKLKSLYKTYLSDGEPFLKKNGHGLRYLTGRVNSYLNGHVPAPDYDSMSDTDAYAAFLKHERKKSKLAAQQNGGTNGTVA